MPARPEKGAVFSNMPPFVRCRTVAEGLGKIQLWSVGDPSPPWSIVSQIGRHQRGRRSATVAE